MIDYKKAIEWSLKQTIFIDYGFAIEEYKITKQTHLYLVEKVRDYFNNNGIKYDTFDYNDLKPYL